MRVEWVKGESDCIGVGGGVRWGRGREGGGVIGMGGVRSEGTL